MRMMLDKFLRWACQSELNAQLRKTTTEKTT